MVNYQKLTCNLACNAIQRKNDRGPRAAVQKLTQTLIDFFIDSEIRWYTGRGPWAGLVVKNLLLFLFSTM